MYHSLDFAGSTYSITDEQEGKFGGDFDTVMPPQKEGIYFRPTANEPSLGTDGIVASPDAIVRVENLSVSWSYDLEKAIFFDINFEVNHV